MSAVPSRWAIHRRDRANAAARFLGFDRAGRMSWVQSWGHAIAFPSQRQATNFMRHRMGIHARDAVAERHTLH